MALAILSPTIHSARPTLPAAGISDRVMVLEMATAAGQGPLTCQGGTSRRQRRQGRLHRRVRASFNCRGISLKQCVITKHTC